MIRLICLYLILIFLSFLKKIHLKCLLIKWLYTITRSLWPFTSTLRIAFSEDSDDWTANKSSLTDGASPRFHRIDRSKYLVWLLSCGDCPRSHLVEHTVAVDLVEYAQPSQQQFCFLTRISQNMNNLTNTSQNDKKLVNKLLIFS